MTPLAASQIGKTLGFWWCSPQWIISRKLQSNALLWLLLHVSWFACLWLSNVSINWERPEGIPKRICSLRRTWEAKGKGSFVCNGRICSWYWCLMCMTRQGNQLAMWVSIIGRELHRCEVERRNRKEKETVSIKCPYVITHYDKYTEGMDLPKSLNKKT